MKNNTKLTNKTLKIILTLLLLVGQFGISTRNISADGAQQISSWRDLVNAAEASGDYVLTDDIYAEGSIEVKANINHSIKSSDENKVYTIYQKQRDTYDSLFKVKNGGFLTLGKNLTLSGKVYQCGPGTAEAIEETEPNNHELSEFHKTEGGSTQASFTSGDKKLSNSSGKQINLVGTSTGYPLTVFEIEDGMLKVGSEYVNAERNGDYQLKGYNNKALLLCDESGNTVSAVSEGNTYVIKDPTLGGYIKFDGEYLASNASLDEALKLVPGDLASGSSVSSYWEIPIKKPINDPNSMQKFTDPGQETAAIAALNYLNEELDPKEKYKHVPDAVLSDITNKYYYFAEQDEWVNSNGKTIDEAMAEYNASNPSCTLKCPNEVVDITDNKLTVTIENKLEEVKDADEKDIGYKNATVSSWEGLKTEIDNGGTQTITLGSDFPYNGESIVLPQDSDITIKGSATIYSSNQEKYEPMFKVGSGAKLTIDEGVTLSAKTSLDDAGCPANSIYTADKFTGDLSTDGKTYSPKGFFIHVESGGNALLNGTISDFITSRDKATTPRYVAPVVANGSGAVFNIGEKGVIKNNVVGYIVKDEMANNDAQTIKQYVKGASPNVPRVPNVATQQANKNKFGNRPRAKAAGIDDGVPGSGITATAGAVIYKDGAKGSIEGTIENNRGDTGGIMSSGSNTTVTIKDKTKITKNVGVQFGGGSTAEQDGAIVMTGGVMTENVAWFGGGAVYATENGVDWLLGRMNGDDGLTPQFGDRKDGQFFMTGGELTRNTAFTRGGAVLVDSNGVNIQEGILAYNMGRMLGGAMYVMGDDPNYEYTVQMTGLYVHDNAAVSGESETWGATAPNSTILNDVWGSGWANLNAPLQTLLQAPSPCADGDLFDSTKTVTGGKAGGNTDDWTDGVGSQGTGGGVWLCAYGNTIFDANAPDKVVITNNWATGAPGAPFNQNGAYHKTLKGSDLADAENNSVPSKITPTTDSRSGMAAGNDFHADTGNRGKVSIGNLNQAQWYDENTGDKYETEVSQGRLNLVNKSTAKMPDADVKVQVYGNLSRHGGGLAADGTFIFGTGTDEATPSASMKVEKEWARSVKKEAVTIITKVKTASGEVVNLAEVELDGEANPPATEFDTIEELDPAGNTWNGKFNFPQNIETSSGSEKLYALVYTGPTVNTGIFDVVAGMELDPLTQKGKNALGAVLKAGYKDKIKILFGEPVYESTESEPKIVKEKTPGSGEYDYTPIEFLFEEWKKDESTGVLKQCEDYIFLASEIDLSNINTNIIATPHYQTTYDPATGEIVNTTTINYHIYLFEIPLTAPLFNDNYPVTEKYVNKNVHTDIVNFDQEFVYDIMAYVPYSATEFTISDTLVKGLEFADKDGNASTDPKEVIRSIVVKDSNNHQVGKNGTVEADSVLHTRDGKEIDFMDWGPTYYPIMDITDRTLTVKFDHTKPTDNRVFGINNAEESWVPGRWVQVTFNARIKDEYRSLEALKSLEAEVNGKTDSWEDTSTDKKSPDAMDITYYNGDLGLVEALVKEYGEDPVIWAVEAPSRLFARTRNGDYYATPMNDKTGGTWKLIDKNGSETDFASGAWENANARYNGLPPYANNTIRQIQLDDPLLNQLKSQPKIKGHTLVKGAEGGTRLFVQTTDANGITHYFATPNNDKTGAVWEEITDQNSDDYKNAVARLKPDRYTIRMLDLTSTTITLDKDGKNWPVISEEEHEGMANQGTYNVKFGNNAEGTYKTNTVTVKPKEFIDIEVNKTWDDIDNLDELRPSEVVVNLMANGDIVASATISEKDGWKYVFKDIEKGPEYTIEEEVVSYYVAEITGDAQDGFEIINHYRSYLPGKRKITSEETGEFTLSKTAEENVSKEIEFTFKVKMLIEEEGNETRTFEETVKLKVGESKKYDFVAEGTEVEIVEVDANNYEITYYLEDAIISKPIFVVEKDGQHAFNVHNKIKPTRKPSVPNTGVK